MLQFRISENIKYIIRECNQSKNRVAITFSIDTYDATI